MYREDWYFIFIEDLNVLATEGITVVNGGVEQTFRGALLLWLGDNLASNAIGGFKQSFSFALHFCRTCYITNDESQGTVVPCI